MTDPPLVTVDLATLGFALGTLFSQQRTLTTQRALANATKAFLINLGMNVSAMSSHELETLLYHVGRGYAKPFRTPPRGNQKGAHSHEGTL